MSSNDHEPKTCLVTGASSGIGRATVVALSAQGMRVHAAARRRERLDELAAETGCATHVLDVTDETGVRSVISSIESSGPIDVLVNNAGLGRGWGSLADATFADIERTVSTNVTAAIHVVQVVLPGMIERGRGHIVNLGSMAGILPLPAALYGATKGAINRLSTNLRIELAGTGIRVTEICPGRVQSEFYDVAIDDPAERRRIQDSGIQEVTAAECAEAIVYCIGVPDHININRLEIQPTEQTYGGSAFVANRGTR